MVLGKTVVKCKANLVTPMGVVNSGELGVVVDDVYEPGKSRYHLAGA